MATSGDVAEGAVLGALLKGGCAVLIPFGQNHPFDLVVRRSAAHYVEIQCKTGWSRDGCVLFNSCSTDHGRGRQDYRGRADVFAVYAPWLDQVFVVPVEAAATRTTTLRLRPAANRQSRRVNRAEDFLLERHLDALRPLPETGSEGSLAA